MAGVREPERPHILPARRHRPDRAMATAESLALATRATGCSVWSCFRQATAGAHLTTTTEKRGETDRGCGRSASRSGSAGARVLRLVLRAQPRSGGSVKHPTAARMVLSTLTGLNPGGINRKVVTDATSSQCRTHSLARLFA